MAIKIFCLDVEGEGEKEGDQNEEGREETALETNGVRRAVTHRNLYRYKLGKIIMTEICISISYGK